MTRPSPPWTPLSLSTPAIHLRQLAGGMAPVTDPRRAAALGVPLGTLAPVLTLTEAAALLGLRTLSSVQTAEIREADGASSTLATLRRRADAYGLEMGIWVRRR